MDPRTDTIGHGWESAGAACIRRSSGRFVDPIVTPSVASILVPRIRGMKPVLAATGGDVLTEEQTSTQESLDIPWNVIVHNDPINLMDYVTKVLMKIFGFPKKKAEIHMLEVHQKGRSIVWSGAREKAELYVQQLHEHLLLATIAKAR